MEDQRRRAEEVRVLRQVLTDHNRLVLVGNFVFIRREPVFEERFNANIEMEPWRFVELVALCAKIMEVGVR